MSEFCEKLEEKLKKVMTSERGSFRFMEPMKRHTTFRIGGPAAVFISPGSEEDGLQCGTGTVQPCTGQFKGNVSVKIGSKEE